jgi:hypothetical protein
VHEAWVRLWKAQQQAETAVNQARAARFDAVQALNDTLRRVLRTLLVNVGTDITLLRAYLPGGGMDVLYRPVARQLQELQPYAAVIAEAPDRLLPALVREAFARTYAQACRCQEAVLLAQQRSLETQHARLAADSLWSEAFRALQRVLDQVAFRERQLAREWQLEWAGAGGSAAASGNRAATNGGELQVTARAGG